MSYAAGQYPRAEDHYARLIRGNAKDSQQGLASVAVSLAGTVSRQGSFEQLVFALQARLEVVEKDYVPRAQYDQLEARVTALENERNQE